MYFHVTITPHEPPTLLVNHLAPLVSLSLSLSSYYDGLA